MGLATTIARDLGRIRKAKGVVSAEKPKFR